MMYGFYQTQADLLAAYRPFARGAASILSQLDFGTLTSPALRNLRAAYAMLATAGLSHQRPPFGFDEVVVRGARARVTEEVADETPFGNLLHFRKNPAPAQPRVLVVAPLSGHFATLLRGTVNVLLPDHDLFITDWKNARDTPKSAGAFGLDDAIAHVIRFLERIGPGAHVVAVCQPTVPVLAAVAVMAGADNPAQPRSMTLMAGPIDTRVNPTRVNDLARSRPITWFEKNLITTVPWRYRGAGRRVYPGFLQLAAFVSMNLDRHVSAHFSQFRNLVGGDTPSAEAHRQFYDEYNAVMDLPAEFYLETVRRVFQDAELASGRFRWRGELVRPQAIRRTALLTVEGERDDICSIGQTVAALDLCSGLRPSMKRHHLQTGVGHYGVFSGRRWAQEVAPLVREMIAVTESRG